MKPGAFWGALLLLTLLAAALRLGVSELAFPPRPDGDELYYVGTAVNLAEGHGHMFNRHERAFRPPAQAWLLSHAVDVKLRRAHLDPSDFLERLRDLDHAHPDPELVAFLRPLLRVAWLLGSLLVPLTALLGVLLFDARTGLLAGALASVLPTLVAFSHYLMSETLFALLVCAGLALAVASRDRRSALLAGAAGLAFGAAALTRELGAPLAALCAVWGVLSVEAGARRAAVARGVLLCLCTLLVVAPWTWRNSALFGRLVPVSTVGWFAAGEGNTLEHPDWLRPFGPRRLDFKIHFFGIEDEMQRVDFARRYTLEQIAAEQPLWLPRKLVRNLGLLLTPGSLLLDRLRSGTYPDPGRAAMRAVLLAHLLLYALLLCGGALGVALAGADGRRSLALLVFGSVCALHVLTNATPRFRVPWLPLLAVYASYGVLHGRRAFRPGARRALAAPLALLVFGVWAGVTFSAGEIAAVWRDAPPAAPASP
jgi:4-amino-4-deoxy-L-arabinose transferase-like glycosyltransferase